VAQQGYAPPALGRRQILIAFSGLLIAIFLASLDQTIVATAMPTIAGELGGVNHIPWATTAYLLASTATIPLWGKGGDLYGRKLLLIVAIVVFVAGSVACGTAGNMNALIGFRAIQGAGAGGLITLAMASVGDLVSPRERGRYQGYIQLTFAVASIAGPLVGGALATASTWRWVFYVNVPVAVIALVVCSTVLSGAQRKNQHRLDYVGTALLVGCVCCFLLATVWGGQVYAWGSAEVTGMLVGFAVLLAAFLGWEGRAAEPILPLAMLATPVVAVASITLFMVTCCFFAALVYGPIFIQVVDGDTALDSGLLLLPMLLGTIVTTSISGWVITKTGKYKLWPLAGTFLLIVAMVLFSLLTPGSGKAEAMGCLLVLGLGYGMITQVLVTAIQNTVEQRQLGTATGTANFFRSLGGAVGSAVFGTVFATRLASELTRQVPSGAASRLNVPSLIGSPAQVAALPSNVRRGIAVAVAHSEHPVFLLAVAIAAIAFLTVFALKEVPLRRWPQGPQQGAGQQASGRVAGQWTQGQQPDGARPGTQQAAGQ
jgi:EmrB/QacA subfamily drug resistance transporter